MHNVMHVDVHEGRKKEASKVKQTNKAKQHSTPKAITFISTCICFMGSYSMSSTFISSVFWKFATSVSPCMSLL